MKPRLLLLSVCLLGLACRQQTPPPSKKDSADKAPASRPDSRAATYSASPAAYRWIEDFEPADILANRISPPDGFQRQQTAEASFAHWLRRLPLKKGQPRVHLFDGRVKGNQSAHVAVIDIDVGPRDLQQCADAAIRLRAEYLYANGMANRIAFNFTSGDRASFRQWSRGFRPAVQGNTVRWARSAPAESSYRTFRNYLRTVFAYAGTLSLIGELPRVFDVGRMQIGDIFIQGGSPGHAVIVVDMATDRKMGRRVFLLAQSFMPAQDVHILKNPGHPAMSPWYDVDFGSRLRTPEWTFTPNDLRRFE